VLDHYGYRITNLTTEWTKYTVSFSHSPRTVGAAQGRLRPVDHLRGAVPDSENNTFGVWIDDVAFVIGTSN